MRYIDMSGTAGRLWDKFALRPFLLKEGEASTEKTKYGKHDAEDRNELCERLARRQGFLCGFCMGHLTVTNHQGNPTWSKVKVAHLQAQALEDEQKKNFSKDALEVEEERRRKLGLDHRNMILACQGETRGVFHCDTHQHNRDLLTIEFDRQDLMDQVVFPPVTILDEVTKYNPRPTRSTPGLLVQGPHAWQREIGALEARSDKGSLLNLNNKLLCRRRREVLDEFKARLKKEDKWTPDNYRSWIKYLTTPDANGRFPLAYSQVIIRYLEKLIRQHAR